MSQKHGRVDYALVAQPYQGWYGECVDQLHPDGWKVRSQQLEFKKGGKKEEEEEEEEDNLQIEDPHQCSDPTTGPYRDPPFDHGRPHWLESHLGQRFSDTAQRSMIQNPLLAGRISDVTESDDREP